MSFKIIIFTLIGYAWVIAHSSDFSKNTAVTTRQSSSISCRLSLDPGLASKIEGKIDEIKRREEELLLAGGTTPSIFDRIKPGDEIGFQDGATFVVESNQKLNLNFVKISISRHNINGLEVDPKDLELIVPRYSAENIALTIVSEGQITQNPRSILKFMDENKSQLEGLLPIREFLRIEPGGSYALARRIPDFRGKQMTLGQFISDPELSAKDRELLAEKLVIFLKSSINIRFGALGFDSALIFDPNDRRWKFQIIDQSLRRYAGDTFVQNVLVAIEIGRPADTQFFKVLHEDISDLAWEIEDSGRAAFKGKKSNR